MFSQNGAGLQRLVGLGSILSAMALAGAASAAQSGSPLAVSAVYTADVQGVASRPEGSAGRYLDNLDVIADLDLEKAVGWRGATLHGYLLNNSGGAPNDLAGTLQGTDNIEVARPRARLFELWFEQTIGHSSALAGLYNLNSEFYANESAALLIAPPFGIGSELAATGPNGPSIFPSTALGVRFNHDFGGGAYARAAAINAKSGVVGDAGGVDFSFNDGVLAIAEAGVTGPTRLGAGAWIYSRRQDDIRALTAAGDPVRRHAHGFYVLGERRLAGGEDRRTTTAFFRVGLSDGDTTPFTGGWQVGLRVDRVWTNRPDSAVSIGMHQGRLDAKYKANQRDAGFDPAAAETGVELTYADTLLRRVTLQPDVQWIRNAGGEAGIDNRWVVGLRLKIDLTPGSASGS